MPNRLGRTDRATAYLKSLIGFSHDARLFLLTSVLYGAAWGIYWVDFNLYLSAIGVGSALIGLIVSAGWLATVIVSLPAAAAAEHFGYRPVLFAAMAVTALGGVTILALGSLAGAVILALGFGFGNGAFRTIVAPYLTDLSEPGERDILFAAQFSVTNLMALVVLLLGVVLVPASLAGGGAQPPEAFRGLLVVMTVGAGAAAASTLALSRREGRRARPAIGSAVAARRLPRFGGVAIPSFPSLAGIPRRLIVPWVLVNFGAGQLMPFLNLFVQRRFDLSIVEVNQIFALVQGGTFVAVLLQPLLVRRYGRVTAVGIVQSLSLPFLLAIGFSGVFAVVAVSMVLRNSLMTAGNPIFYAFSMDSAPPERRSRLAAILQISGAAAFVLGGSWFSMTQAVAGFEMGYVIAFITTATLYATATTLFWVWFRTRSYDVPHRSVMPGDLW